MSMLEQLAKRIGQETMGVATASEPMPDDDLSGYEIWVRVWYDAGCMGQPAQENPAKGPYATLQEARAVYDKLGGGENFVARKVIELRPKP